MRRSKTFLALAAGAGFLFAACSGSPASQAPAEATDVRLQLQWVPQAQFAGYFAAAAEGYYEDAGLNVTFVPASPDLAPHVAGSAADGPEFTISWVPKVLEARVGTPPSDLVNIAQMFQRSGTLSVSWKDSNITSPADFAEEGRRLGLRQRVRGHRCRPKERGVPLSRRRRPQRPFLPLHRACLGGQRRRTPRRIPLRGSTSATVSWRQCLGVTGRSSDVHPMDEDRVPWQFVRLIGAVPSSTDTPSRPEAVDDDRQRWCRSSRRNIGYRTCTDNADAQAGCRRGLVS